MARLNVDPLTNECLHCPRPFFGIFGLFWGALFFFEPVIAVTSEKAPSIRKMAVLLKGGAKKDVCAALSTDVLERPYTAGGGEDPPPPPPRLLLFQCLRLTAKIWLRRLRCQEDLRFKTFGPPSAGTIGEPSEEGRGPSQPPPPPLFRPPPPLLIHPCPSVSRVTHPQT